MLISSVASIGLAFMTSNSPNINNTFEITPSLSEFNTTLYDNQWMENNFFISSLSGTYPFDDINEEHLDALNSKSAPNLNITKTYKVNLNKVESPVLPYDFDDDLLLIEDLE